MTELSDKARHLCGTPGVSVYLRAFGETQFRASVTWTSDAPIPHAPDWMPRVFAWILETGEALVFPDLAKQPAPDVPSTWPDGVRGLVAVPIVTADEQFIGMICVFDLKPLAFGGSEVAALKALGRGVSVGSAAAPVNAVGGDQQMGGPTPTASQANCCNRITQPLDPPTALLDRGGGYVAISRELARARREQRQLSVIMFDVVAFSRTNDGPVPEPAPDLFGTVGETLMKAIRGSDLAIRWSGDELLLVLLNLGVTEARPVAQLTARGGTEAGARHRVAVAGGMAELLADEALESVVARASAEKDAVGAGARSQPRQPDKSSSQVAPDTVPPIPQMLASGYRWAVLSSMKLTDRRMLPDDRENRRRCAGYRQIPRSVGIGIGVARVNAFQ